MEFSLKACELVNLRITMHINEIVMYFYHLIPMPKLSIEWQREDNILRNLSKKHVSIMLIKKIMNMLLYLLLEYGLSVHQVKTQNSKNSCSLIKIFKLEVSSSSNMKNVNQTKPSHVRVIFVSTTTHELAYIIQIHTIHHSWKINLFSLNYLKLLCIT